ncbi:NACHT domain-containing protein [Lentzea waywayandensis]|uniref:NACHT domain-containing protein n=1 Tax=Lentzea waywayandensis TaxID=84724 RepID=UPI0015A5A2E9|nr:NACHT domain-containing protein [Lentzea waywayandensis]
MADEDLTSNSTGDVHGIAFQAHTVHGNVYLNGSSPTDNLPCAPPASWADAVGLPTEIEHLLWAQQQTADLLPYQLPGARTPALGTIYVRQGLGGGVEDSTTSQARSAPMLDEHGRLVEIPATPSVRVAVRPPSKLLRAALDADRHVLVLGGPGQGKSTLTLRLSADIAAEWTRRAPDDAPLAEPVIPLRVTARTLAQHLGSAFTQALADSAFVEHGRYLNGPLDPALFADRVAGCRWLLLVDALDEVTDSALRATLVHTLSAWATRGIHRVLLTTRPTEGGALAALQRAGAAHYELQPFDQEALRRFAHNWFEEIGEDHADRFLQQIHEAHLAELVEVPLLATIAAIVFEQYRDRPLPGNQYELYESYLNFILSSRPTVEVFEHHRVALVEHLGRTRLTSESSLTAAAQDWGSCNGVPRIDDLLRYLLNVGPFVKRGNDIAFLHQSFAEHVAATSKARELPSEFTPRHDSFAELLHEGYQEDSGTFARSVLLHHSHLNDGEADRTLRWLHTGGSEEHLLAARLLAHHLPASTPVVEKFLVTARAWAMTTRYPARLILRETSRATRHTGLAEWLAQLMGDPVAPWESRLEAAVALGVRLRCAYTDAAIALLRAAVDDMSAGVDGRLVAAEALAHSGSREREVAERGLRSVLEDEDASGADHRSAAVVLSAFGQDSRALAVSALERLMSDVDTPLRDVVEAATGLLEIDPEFQDQCAETFLSVLMDHSHSSAGWYDATIGLASLGRREQAAEALTARLASTTFPGGLRSGVASMLALLGPQHRVAAADYLLSEQDDPMVSRVDKLISAPELAHLGHRDRAVAVLRETLADPTSNWNHSNLAAMNLADLGPAFHGEAAAQFESALDHMLPKGYEYQQALRRLADIGEPHRSRSLDLMWALLADPDADPDSRCSVASDLVQFAPERHPEVAQHLLAIIKADNNPSVLVSAWRELVSFGPDLCREAKSALLALTEHVRDCVDAPLVLGRTFSSFGAADRALAADLLTMVARDERRSARPRLSAARGVNRLGRAYHRRAAGLLSELVEAGLPLSMNTATLLFAESGPGVRLVLAEALHGVLRNERTSSARVWSAVQSLVYLGHRAPDEVLRAVVADESAPFWRRMESALMLSDLDEKFLPVALTLHERGVAEMSFVMWQNYASKATRAGADIRERLRAMSGDPSASCQAKAAAAALLGREGIPELRAQADDAYLGLDLRSRSYSFLAAADPAFMADAVAFHRSVMDDLAQPVRIRCAMAVELMRLDRSATSSVISFLWRLAESPRLHVWERASAALQLASFDDPVSPRMVQIIVGLCRDPALNDTSRVRLAALLPRPHRTGMERVLLVDRSARLADRLPAPDSWGDRSFILESEEAVREILACPTSSREERRDAAKELGRLSEKHVPEAVGMLLADGSPEALAIAAKLGEWQPVLDRVLDEARPLRERLATVLRLPNMAANPTVRDMLLRQPHLSWRDRVDVLAYVGQFDELRALRDDQAGLLVQRWRAANKLVELTASDRSSAADLYRQIATDPAVRPSRRMQAAEDLGKLGARGRTEAELLTRAMLAEAGLPVRVRSNAANWLRNYLRTSQDEVLAIQRKLVAPTVLGRIYVLRSISWAPSQEALDELLALAADPALSPRIRLWCARSVVERRRDLRDRCAVVAKDIAFDADAPWQIRLRAARCLARWSEVMRADAIALVKKKCAE